jgi:hypothetical protein
MPQLTVVFLIFSVSDSPWSCPRCRSVKRITLTRGKWVVCHPEITQKPRNDHPRIGTGKIILAGWYLARRVMGRAGREARETGNPHPLLQRGSTRGGRPAPAHGAHGDCRARPKKQEGVGATIGTHASTYLQNHPLPRSQQVPNACMHSDRLQTRTVAWSCCCLGRGPPD